MSEARVAEAVNKLAAKDFPPEQKFLNPDQIMQRMKFLDEQRKDLKRIIDREYDKRIRELGQQRETMLGNRLAEGAGA